ncbi:hypothetical protein [Paraburkholderia fungorum]|uniref:hypothetical protein n=1 Tax=Paraburkholderia fungorum TaxID=134537 RepID=UPI0038BE16A4
MKTAAAITLLVAFVMLGGCSKSGDVTTSAYKPMDYQGQGFTTSGPATVAKGNSDAQSKR